VVVENDGELAESVNAGFRAAKTEFVLLMGSDDVAAPGMVERLRGLAWNADVVYPSMTLVDEKLKQRLGEHPAAPFCPNRLRDMNFVPGVAVVRRSKFLEAGGERELPWLEDWDLWVRMHRAGARFKPCPEATLFYRRHDQARNVLTAEIIETARRRIVGVPSMAETALATFYNQATPATTYLRCQLPARYLPGICKPVYELEVAANDDEVEFRTHRGKAAVLQFAADKHSALMTGMFQSQGIRVLVEVDDNYLTVPERRIAERQGWAMRIGDGPFTRQGHRWIAERANGVIVTTPYLADKYREVNETVFICPNTVDPVDWPELRQPDDGVLRIVWFASRSHEGDELLIGRAFAWAAQQPDVEVYVAGLRPSWSFEFGWLPWIDDLDLYRYHFGWFDVGVAPIRMSPMGWARSDVKALEMAMGGQAPVLTDAPPYDGWRDGETCLKAGDANGFLDAIKRLVRNRGLVKELAAAAREYTLSERTTERQIHLWRQAING
jgi:hypothetical protein